MSDFQGQSALVTGASRGIGRQIATDLALAGAQVVLVSRNEERLEACAGELRSRGCQVLARAVDVSDSGLVQAAVSEILAKVGSIDILVNNAGITRDTLLMRMNEEAWKQVICTNLDSVFHLTRALLPAMVKRRYGRIINLTSVVGQMGNAGQCNYAASKAGVIGFTKALAREVASRNVTVNAIAPGFIETDMTASLTEKARQELQANIPVRRIGTVKDVSSGVCFLASKEAGYITGHVLNINGGMYM